VDHGHPNRLPAVCSRNSTNIPYAWGKTTAGLRRRTSDRTGAIRPNSPRSRPGERPEATAGRRCGRATPRLAAPAQGGARLGPNEPVTHGRPGRALGAGLRTLPRALGALSKASKSRHRARHSWRSEGGSRSTAAPGHGVGPGLRPPDLRDFDLEPFWEFQCPVRSNTPAVVRCRDR
jgi:hypothetical protein